MREPTRVCRLVTGSIALPERQSDASNSVRQSDASNLCIRPGGKFLPQVGVLEDMRAPTGVCGPYADDLFSAPRPSAAAFSESTAFRQFLQCLHGQVATAQRETFEETVSAHEEMLNQAEELLDKLHSVGVRGQNRDFKEIVDVNRAAISVLRLGVFYCHRRLRRVLNSKGGLDHGQAISRQSHGFEPYSGRQTENCCQSHQSCPCLN